MTRSLTIQGLPVVLLEAGLVEDGITFGIRRPICDHAGRMERYSRNAFSMTELDAMIREVRQKLAAPGLPLHVLMSVETWERYITEMRLRSEKR